MATDTRDMILKAALDMFWQHGIQGASMDAISAAAGVGKGALYHHFPTKVDLVIAAFDAAWEESKLLLDPIFSPSFTPYQQVATFCDLLQLRQQEKARLHGRVLGCPFLACVNDMCSETDRIGLHAQQVMLRYRHYMVQLVKHTKASCQTRYAVSDDTLADCLHAYVLGVLTHARVANDLSNMHQIMAAGMRQLLGIEKDEQR